MQREPVREAKRLNASGLAESERTERAARRARFISRAALKPWGVGWTYGSARVALRDVLVRVQGILCCDGEKANSAQAHPATAGEKPVLSKTIGTRQLRLRGGNFMYELKLRC